MTDGLDVLAETKLREFSAVCPNCAEIVCQLSLEEPGGLTGFEAVCPGCESAVFIVDVVAVPDDTGSIPPVGDLRETALDFYDRTEWGRRLSGSDWEWAMDADGGGDA